ncbi:hypothetical protein ACFQ4N_08565 [Oceanobacillus iheyensis]|uniref:hypothetical protein n=1 Tax=Oceanobacillus iheyensis TaxID=182710 RepID=UPI0036346656
MSFVRHSRTYTRAVKVNIDSHTLIVFPLSQRNKEVRPGEPPLEKQGRRTYGDKRALSLLFQREEQDKIKLLGILLFLGQVMLETIHWLYYNHCNTKFVLLCK